MPELETLLPNSPGIPAEEMRFESQDHIRWQQRENFTFSWLSSCFLYWNFYTSHAFLLSWATWSMLSFSVLDSRL